MCTKWLCSTLLILGIYLASSGCQHSQQQCPSAAPPSLEPAAGTVPLGQGEGMWPLGLLGDLDEGRLRERGLSIPLSSLWNADQGGLARAAVYLGGCSASFVSSEGLIVTNHHCAYQAIARNSSEENNWLVDGFVAENRRAELPGQGLKVQVLQSFVDVTEQVLEDLPTEPAERVRALEQRESRLVAQCEEQPHRRCHVSRFTDGIAYEGAPDGRPRFTLFETIELRDVRIVAAPPQSLGNFGGEVDNWHWPRHTADFTVLRAYVGPDGTPAEHDEANQPYRPETYFQISRDGVGPNDLVMVMGYPWSTERHLTAAELEEQQTWYYPLRVDLFSQWSQLLHEHQRRSEEARLHIAPHVRRIDNGLSHARGMMEALPRIDVLGQRRSEEQVLSQWIQADPSRSSRFGELLGEIRQVVEERSRTRDRNLLLRYLVYGSQLLGFARTVTRWAAEQQRPDLEREPGYQDRDADSLQAELRHAQQSLDLTADRAVFELIVSRAMALPEGLRIEALDAAVGSDRSAAAVAAFGSRIYDNTQLGDVEQRLSMFGQGRAALEASQDAMIVLALALEDILDEREDLAEERAQTLSRLRPGLMLANQESTGVAIYPDANASLRISFGNVRGYSPRDGILYTPQTTLTGLVRKHSDEDPFDVPEGVLVAHSRGQHGSFADPNLDDVVTCFLSDIDTTGGNSGSPVLDGSGRLVGLLFDGVWEDLAGDFAYSPRLSRSITVDIRYVLWLLSQVMDAQELVDELVGNDEPS